MGSVGRVSEGGGSVRRISQRTSGKWGRVSQGSSSKWCGVGEGCSVGQGSRDSIVVPGEALGALRNHRSRGSRIGQRGTVRHWGDDSWLSERAAHSHQDDKDLQVVCTLDLRKGSQ